jgi:FKBP-type peptidyl-prolyl cis-trans isomerase FkpA
MTRICNFFVALGVTVVIASGGCRRKTTSDNAAADSVPMSIPGLKIEEIKKGQGPAATKGKIVALHYTGYLPDGSAFDTTRNRQPLRFQLGEGTVLKGWDLGIDGMKVGGQRKLTVAPELAFGDRTVGQIKPNSTLVFDVELVSVK